MIPVPRGTNFAVLGLLFIAFAVAAIFAQNWALALICGVVAAGLFTLSKVVRR